jgi:medium-chain acyl-[acyl-carrier-protein] hydrolase
MTIRASRLRSDAALRLFCLPYAGGSAQVFREWPAHLPPRIEVVPLERKGRGTRFTERPDDRLDAIAHEAAAAIAAVADRPFALFGHSMGALTAFEVAHALGGHEGLQYLFVSGHRAPDEAARGPLAHALPDDRLLAHLRRLDPASPALADDDLMRHMLPVVRADLTACETFTFRERPPLACGIAAFGGETDPLVDAEQLLAWRRHTRGPFRRQLFPGNHFFLHTCLPALVASLVGDLEHAGAFERAG